MVSPFNHISHLTPALISILPFDVTAVRIRGGSLTSVLPPRTGEKDATGLVLCMWGLWIFWKEHGILLKHIPHPHPKRTLSLCCSRSFASPPERAPLADPRPSGGSVLTPGALLGPSARLEWPMQGLLTSNVRQIPWFCRGTPSALERWATWETNGQISLRSTGKVVCS